MFQSHNAYNRQRTTSTLAAALVVAFTGLMFNHGHLGALPAGVVEVGELTPINLEQIAMVTLPAIEVVGSREQLLAGDPSMIAQEPRG